MSKLKELQEAEVAALNARQKIVSISGRLRADMIREATERIDLFIEQEYGERIRQLTEAYQQAEAARIAEQDRLAREEPKSPFPVGTRVEEWKKNDPWSAWYSTGRVGVIEVCTSDSQFPKSAQHGLPSIGRWFVRLLDKKGKPTKLFVMSSEMSLPWGWVLEGKKPKT